MAEIKPNPRPRRVLVVAPHPAGVASTIPAKRGESAEELAERRREHLDLLMYQRVLVEWKAERLPEESPGVDHAAFEHLSHAEKVRLWVTRMHAGLPVQVSDPARAADIASLVQDTHADS